jgi:hypothetical protein
MLVLGKSGTKLLDSGYIKGYSINLRLCHVSVGADGGGNDADNKDQPRHFVPAVFS